MFKFSLQTALDVRARQEKMKMKDLAEKLAVEQKIKDQISQINRDTNEADSRMNRSKNARAISIDQLSYLSRYKSRMKTTMAMRQKELKAAMAEVAEKQKALIEASKAKKTLEILKEKEEKQYLEKISTMINKNLDEIAGNQFILKQRGN